MTKKFRIRGKKKGKSQTGHKSRAGVVIAQGGEQKREFGLVITAQKADLGALRPTKQSVVLYAESMSPSSVAFIFSGYDTLMLLKCPPLLWELP